MVNAAQETGMDTNNVENIDNTLTCTPIDLMRNPKYVSDVWAQNDLQQ